MIVRKVVTGATEGYIGGDGENFTLHGQCAVPGEPDIPIRTSQRHDRRRWRGRRRARQHRVDLLRRRGHPEPGPAARRVVRLGRARPRPPGTSADAGRSRGQSSRREPDRACDELVQHRQGRRRPVRRGRSDGDVQRAVLLPVRQRCADHRGLDDHACPTTRSIVPDDPPRVRVHGHREHARPVRAARRFVRLVGTRSSSGRRRSCRRHGHGHRDQHRHPAVGGLQITKTVVDPDGGVLPGATFRGVWECTQGDDTYSDRFTVGAGETTTAFTPADERVPATAVCTITEDTPSARRACVTARSPGARPTYAPDDGHARRRGDRDARRHQHRDARVLRRHRQQGRDRTGGRSRARRSRVHRHDQLPVRHGRTDRDDLVGDHRDPGAARRCARRVGVHGD